MDMIMINACQLVWNRNKTLRYWLRYLILSGEVVSSIVKFVEILNELLSPRRPVFRIGSNKNIVRANLKRSSCIQMLLLKYILFSGCYFCLLQLAKLFILKFKGFDHKRDIKIEIQDQNKALLWQKVDKYVLQGSCVWRVVATLRIVGVVSFRPMT